MDFLRHCAYKLGECVSQEQALENCKIYNTKQGLDKLTFVADLLEDCKEDKIKEYVRDIINTYVKTCQK